MKTEYNNWIERDIDIRISVNGNNDVNISFRENESGDENKLVFSAADEDEYFIERIGQEIYSWILLMKDEVEDENDIV